MVLPLFCIFLFFETGRIGKDFTARSSFPYCNPVCKTVERIYHKDAIIGDKSWLLKIQVIRESETKATYPFFKLG